MSRPAGTGTRLGSAAALVLMGWLTVVLLVDSEGTRTTKAWLGIATWGVLGVALRACDPVVRVQTLVVVAFATGVE